MTFACGTQKSSNSNKLAKVAKLKMRGRKLRSGVNMKVALKQKGLKQTGVKQGFGVF
jgi:4-hydroxy-3-methylbut-2-enyl diphosphate reductase IspH